MSSTANIFGAIFFIIFTVVGFAGNLMTAIVLLRDPKLRQHSTTAFILSLCISDLFFSMFPMPVTAVSFLNELQDFEMCFQDLMFNDTICKFHGSAFMINFAITTYSITAIAINRYILIVHNNLYKIFYQNSLVLLQLLIIWLLPVALMLIPIFDQWGTVGRNKALCKVMEKDGKSSEDFLYVIGIIIPSVIISVLYACIYYKVRQQSRNMSRHISNRSSANERHLTLMTLLIFISFLVCCFPAVIDHFYFIDSKNPWPNALAATFGGLISIIDPFIYAVTNRKYRSAYVKLFSEIKFWDPAEIKETASESN